MIQALFWLFLFPGFYSSDSLGLLEGYSEGKIGSEQTYIWSLITYLITFAGQIPSAATLIYSLLLVGSLTFFCFSIFQEKMASALSLVMSLTPSISVFGITLWHDVPMTAGLLLLSGIIVNNTATSKRGLFLLIVSIVLTNFRHNGGWVTLLSVVVWICLHQIRRKVALALFILVLTGNSFFAILNQKVDEGGSVQRLGITHWMKYDIACAYSNKSNSSSILQSDLIQFLNLEGKGELEVGYSSKIACTWFMEKDKLKNWATIPEKLLVDEWTRIVTSNPMEILRIHSQRAPYLIPLPIVEQRRPAFLHTNIEAKNPYVTSSGNKFYEFARLTGRVWNYFSYITAHAGLWSVIIAVTAIRIKHLRPILALALVLNLSIFVSAIIPDARYVMFTIIVGNLCFLYFFCGQIQKFLNSGRLTRIRPFKTSKP
jgi:hypothetical protein